ncbi:MAG: TPM domain-containing protein [Gemmiger sp.]|nr:TPM domain-containing protein [Gemmiger sp.]
MKKLAKRLLCAAATMALLAAAALPAVAAPQVDTSKCVIDNADILSAETETYITNLTVALSDACGAQIGVYTVNNVGNTSMENYAYQVFDAWGLGDDDKHNGVLLLLSTDDDDYWLMQGQGLETRLPTSTLKDILNNNLESNWVRQDYDRGARQTVRAVAKELSSIYDLRLDVDAVAAGNAGSTGQSGQESDGSGVVIAIVLIMIFIIAAALLLSSRRPRRYRPTVFAPIFFPRGPRGPRGPRPPRGPGGYGGYSNPPRNGGSSFRSGGGSTRGGGASRTGGGFSGGGSFRSGGGGTRGGGAGRH